MRIAAIQSCSLVDYPGHPCLTLFTQGCNLRCPYCHNPSLISNSKEDTLPDHSIWPLLERRADTIGAICITGGEPTLQPGLEAFLNKLRALRYTIKLDTNGTQPDVLRQLMDERLVDYVAMDMKAPFASYNDLAGSSVSPQSLSASIHLLKSSGINHEFRTTVVPHFHNVTAIERIARELEGGHCYYLQAFEPKNAMAPRLRLTPPPDTEMMHACQRAASPFIKCCLR